MSKENEPPKQPSPLSRLKNLINSIRVAYSDSGHAQFLKLTFDLMMREFDEPADLADHEILTLAPEKIAPAMFKLMDHAILVAECMTAGIAAKDQITIKKRFRAIIQSNSSIELGNILFRALQRWFSENKQYLTDSQKVSSFNLYDHIEAILKKPDLRSQIHHRTAFYLLNQSNIEVTKGDPNYAQALLSALLPDLKSSALAVHNFIDEALKLITHPSSTHHKTQLHSPKVRQPETTLSQYIANLISQPALTRDENPLFFFTIIVIVARHVYHLENEPGRIDSLQKNDLQYFAQQLISRFEKLDDPALLFNLEFTSKLAQFLDSFYSAAYTSMLSLFEQGGTRESQLPQRSIPGHQGETPTKKYAPSIMEMSARDAARTALSSLMLWLRTNDHLPKSSRQTVELIELVLQEKQLAAFSQLFQHPSLISFLQGACTEPAVDLYILDKLEQHNNQAGSNLRLLPATAEDEGNKIDRRYFDQTNKILYLLQIKSSTSYMGGLYTEQLHRSQLGQAESKTPDSSVHPAFHHTSNRPTGFGRRFRSTEREKMLSSIETEHSKLVTDKVTVIGLLVYVPGNLAVLKDQLFPIV